MFKKFMLILFVVSIFLPTRGVFAQDEDPCEGGYPLRVLALAEIADLTVVLSLPSAEGCAGLMLRVSNNEESIIKIESDPEWIAEIADWEITYNEYEESLSFPEEISTSNAVQDCGESAISQGCEWMLWNAEGELIATGEPLIYPEGESYICAATWMSVSQVNMSDHYVGETFTIEVWGGECVGGPVIELTTQNYRLLMHTGIDELPDLQGYVAQGMSGEWFLMIPEIE